MDRKTKSIREKSVNDGYYTIGTVSLKTGVKSYILRYWEKEFPFLQPMKNRVGHRLYSERDLFIVKKIKILLYERGFSISGAKKILWDILLGKKKTSKQQYLYEIRSDLHDMLDIIDKNLM